MGKILVLHIIMGFTNASVHCKLSRVMYFTVEYFFIFQIISQQKKEYEAQMSLSISGNKSGSMIVMKPSPIKDVKTDTFESKPNLSEPPSLIPAVKIPATFGQNPNSSAVIPSDNTATGVQENDINFTKNVEIRRISATEEGDKVLESAWDSPEKEKNLGKTPLQMVQSIISKIEKTKPATPVSASAPTTTPVGPPAGPPSGPPTGPPAWTQGGQRPLLHSQKQVANETPPTTRPLTTAMIPPQHQKALAPAQPPPVSPNFTVMAPAHTAQFLPVSANPGQQIMQLVNTINGPMLMQMAAPAPAPVHHQQAPLVAPQQVQIQDKNRMGKKPGHSPTGAQQLAYSPGANTVPILVSPGAAMIAGAGSQTSPTGAQIAPGQHVLISHPSPGSGVQIQGAPQILINQPAMIQAPQQFFMSPNGTLMAMPAPQPVQTGPVVYNQLPDGTLVQVQSPAMIQPQITQPQMMIQTSNGSFVLQNPAGQQLSPTGGQFQFHQATPGHAHPGGTFIMTAAGLVQTVPAATPQQQVAPQQLQQAAAPIAPPMIQQGFDPKPGPSSTSLRKDSTEDSDDDEDDSNDEENDSQNDMKMIKTREIKFVPTDEDEEEESGDSSDEELRPLKAQISPKNAQISPTTSKDQGKANKSKTGSSKTSTSSSPKAIYIQSNKVDSSGLQATPPHPNEGGESDMAGNGNQLSSPDLSAVSPQGRYDGLDTSGSTDGGTAPSSSTRSPHKRKRKRNADELIKQDRASGVESDGELTYIYIKYLLLLNESRMKINNH